MPHGKRLRSPIAGLPLVVSIFKDALLTVLLRVRCFSNFEDVHLAHIHLNISPLSGLTVGCASCDRTRDFTCLFEVTIYSERCKRCLLLCSFEKTPKLVSARVFASQTYIRICGLWRRVDWCKCRQNSTYRSKVIHTYCYANSTRAYYST